MATVHKLLLFLKRKPGLSLEEFRDYYENRHIPLVMTYMAGAERYFRRFIEHPPGQELDFDVITEVWLKERQALDFVMTMLARDGMPPEVIADEERFMDRPKSRFCSVIESETPTEALAGR
jgi:hypothetical protein